VLCIPRADEARLFKKGSFFSRMLKSNASAVAGICEHWAWRNMQASRSFCQALCNAVNTGRAESFPPLFVVFTRLLALQDEFMHQRVDMCLSMLLPVLEQNSDYKEETATCASFLSRLASTNSAVAQWLRAPQSRPKWAWIATFMNQRNAASA
jgi:hypothetical protein